MFIFCYFFFFFNIVLTWKFVEASKASVLYIYIDNNKGKLHFTHLWFAQKTLYPPVI